MLLGLEHSKTDKLGGLILSIPSSFFSPDSESADDILMDLRETLKLCRVERVGNASRKQQQKTYPFLTRTDN